MFIITPNISEILKGTAYFLPEVALVITILLCIILDVIIKKRSVVVASVAVAGLLVSGFFVFQQTGVLVPIFSYMLVVDPFSVFFKYLFILSSIIIIIFFLQSEEIKASSHKNEYTVLVLSLALGAFMMASSINLLMMYLSLELASLTSYILAGYTKKDRRSTEASMKYFIYGAASSGIMLYGITLLYGFTGTLNIYNISIALSTSSIPLPFFVLTVIMIVAGIGYKISSVPFHFWTPDVYEGSPTPVTAFLAVTSSAAGFSMLIRFFSITFLNSATLLNNGSFPAIIGLNWQEIIILLAVSSMVLGNFVAVWQKSMKRLLAYSSIAQAGYMMAGLVVASKLGVIAIMIYLSAYLFMNLGAFYVTLLIVNKLGSDNIDDMKGLAYRSPVICVAMTLFMLALAGIPSTAGFIGKFYLISALLEPGSKYLWLVVVLLLNSVVSLFFYFKVVKKMFLEKPEESNISKIQFGYSNYAILFVLAIPTVVFGLYFTPLLNLAKASAIFFGIN